MPFPLDLIVKSLDQSVSHAGEGAGGGYPTAALLVGYLSIACWMVVSFDQLWLCLEEQSGEGLSLVFLFIWLAGDTTNLVGAVWQDVLPTMIFLAIYYSICDVVLISQVFYYRRLNALKLAPRPLDHESTESTPLLAAESNTARMANWRSRAQIAGVGLLLLSGIWGVVWWVNYSGGSGEDERKEEVWNSGAQVVGWISAALYLGSRVPQIYHNRKTKCQGLSLLMFSFAVAGNSTYVASICLESQTKAHFIINASWLLGSGGTILLDFIVLGQFWWYGNERRKLHEGGKMFIEQDGRGLVEDD